jgi:hypothetical protein
MAAAGVEVVKLSSTKDLSLYLSSSKDDMSID